MPPRNGAGAVASANASWIPASFTPRSRAFVSSVTRTFHGRKNSGMYAPYRTANRR